MITYIYKMTDIIFCIYFVIKIKGSKDSCHKISDIFIIYNIYDVDVG